MSKWLRLLFAVHAVVALVIGGLLLIVPGRLAGWVGWWPVEPILFRLFGAALLGLAWGSLRGCFAKEWFQVKILVEADIVYCVLGCAGVIRHLVVNPHYPWPVWVTLGVLVAFAWMWAAAWVQHTRPHRQAPGSD